MQAAAGVAAQAEDVAATGEQDAAQGYRDTAQAYEETETGDFITGIIKTVAGIGSIAAAPFTGRASVAAGGLLTTISGAETSLGDGSGIY